MYGKLKEQILELRSKGYTYNQIKNTLNCSKGTIAFHCGEGQKEKYNLRRIKRRSTTPLIQKIERFRYIPETVVNEHEKINTISNKTIKAKLIVKLAHFFRKDNNGSKKRYQGYNKYMFTVKQLLEKIGENPVCYLTGTPIDLNKSRSYHLDHIIPKSRGGDDSLENCQIACRAANQAKGDLLVEEFIELCKKVVEKNSK